MVHFGSNKEREYTVVGRLRKAQLITTFGSGAIVDMPDCSVIIAGTNYWRNNSPILHEPNLQKLLRVSCFKEPYVSPDQDVIPKPDVPAFRFPYYHFCPDGKCGKLAPFWLFGDDKKNRTCSNGHQKRVIVPSRFLAGCENGHLEDFPYNWWVHRGHFSKCPAMDSRKESLRISFSDQTGGLESIVIHCTACGATRSMAGCMGKDALQGYRCRGKRPWLGGKDCNDPQPCECQMRTLHRGASNVYFPVTASALTIPPWSKKAHQEVSEKWDLIDAFLSGNQDDAAIKNFIQKLFNTSPFLLNADSLDNLVKDVKRRFEGKGVDCFDRNLREEEYNVFCMGTYEDENDLQFRTVRENVSGILSDFIEDVVLVKRLREVLALRGFRRIFPEGSQKENGERPSDRHDDNYVSLSDDDQNWLPAIELLGEGIFVRLREDALLKWVSRYGDKYKSMKERLTSSGVKCDNFSPRYVLLHTLSHLLIRQLSLECGYSGAAIKERIYSTYPGSEVPMAGVLLYTSSSDSDGSLGGLVRKGKRDSFESTFMNMLQEASWCSSDPICINSSAQGYDALNYAACHACALLPETSCEMRNCLLDRASIIGTDEDRERGLFGTLLLREVEEDRKEGEF